MSETTKTATKAATAAAKRAAAKAAEEAATELVSETVAEKGTEAAINTAIRSRDLRIVGVTLVGATLGVFLVKQGQSLLAKRAAAKAEEGNVEDITRHRESRA